MIDGNLNDAIDIVFNGIFRCDHFVLDHIQFARQLREAGDTSLVVHRVQSALAKLGYSPGRIDGRLGAQTKIAIRTFEADRGWPITGEMTDALLRELDGTYEQSGVALR